MDWKSHLKRWTAAGLLDETTAARIRVWEETQPAEPQGLRWPVLVALACGALLLGAGVLLFVSAHWDNLSPVQRMSLVVVLVAMFHAAGAWASTRFEALAVALHTVGTFALGAGIALTGQIFHLSAHWPAAILLWAIGSGMAWWLLRHWTQAALTAILIPYWLSGEWWVRMRDLGVPSYVAPVAAGICALSFSYLSARRSADDSPLRKALAWIGGLALIPAAFAEAAVSWNNAPSWQEQFIPWTLAIAGPLVVAMLLHGRAAIWNIAATAWVLVLLFANGGHPGRIVEFVWCAAGAIGLVTWGVREERAERINLGMAGFGITVLSFYFSDVMDKLDRSFSLILLGLIFLGGGWLLERTRRQLVARIRPEPA